MRTKFRSLQILSMLILSVMISFNPLVAQNDLVRVDLRLSPFLTDTQSFNYFTLEIGHQAGGVKLFDIILENNTGQVVRDLYVNIALSSSTRGILAELYSADFDPFELQPRQLVLGDNFSLANRLPGIRDFEITGGISPEGENFINSLEGGTRLPDDIYTVTFSIYQGANKRNGGRLLDTVSESFGAVPIQNLVDFYIIQPGGPVGSNEIIMNRTPVFRWDGPSNIQYRIIVVEDNGQNAESLLQNAYSSEPVAGPGATGSTLLEFEMIDALVNGNNFQYPASGVPALREGKRYYWQLFARFISVSGIDERPSGIMEFTIPLADGRPGEFVLTEEILRIISEIDPDTGTELQQILEDQFEISSINIDGIELSGTALVTFLEDFLERFRNGDIIIIR